jgi:hypothetical protein
VIEIDGKRHYAEASRIASPQHYADTVREDCAIRLDGYPVFRFSAAELVGPTGEQLADDFFGRLLARNSPDRGSPVARSQLDAHALA